MKAPAAEAVTYNSAYVAEVAGVPYRTLMRWAEGGLIVPAVYTGRRRVPVQWDEKNIREACILARLRALNFSLQKMRGILRYLRSIGHNPMSTGEFLVILDGKGKPSELVKICDGGEALALMQRRGQLMLPLWNPPERKGGRMS